MSGSILYWNLNKMDKFPRVITQIIEKYARDMHLLEQTPHPGLFTGMITPMHFDVVMGATTLTELLLSNILEAVSDAPPASNLTDLFVYSKLAECVEFPLSVINNFECAHKLWIERCALYGILGTLPPNWVDSLPYLIFEFIHCYDIDLLFIRLNRWLGANNVITDSHPFVMLRLPG